MVNVDFYSQSVARCRIDSKIAQVYEINVKVGLPEPYVTDIMIVI